MPQLADRGYSRWAPTGKRLPMGPLSSLLILTFVQKHHQSTHLFNNSMCQNALLLSGSSNNKVSIFFIKEKRAANNNKSNDEVMLTSCISVPSTAFQPFTPLPSFILTLPLWGEKEDPGSSSHPPHVTKSGREGAQSQAVPTLCSWALRESKEHHAGDTFHRRHRPQKTPRWQEKLSQVRTLNEMALSELSFVVLPWVFKKVLWKRASCKLQLHFPEQWPLAELQGGSDFWGLTWQLDKHFCPIRNLPFQAWVQETFAATMLLAFLQRRKESFVYACFPFHLACQETS